MKKWIAMLLALVLALGLTACAANAGANGGSRSGSGSGNGNGNGTQAPESGEQGISQEEAQAIALEHAGLTADQVTRLHVEYEYGFYVNSWGRDKIV